MAKIDNRPKEKMRLTIEFADNGIILRDPNCEDIVELALTGKGTIKSMGGEYYAPDHNQEYEAIGKKVYDWLTDVVVCDHKDEIIATGAELEVIATLTGRKR